MTNVSKKQKKSYSPLWIKVNSLISQSITEEELDTIDLSGLTGIEAKWAAKNLEQKRMIILGRDCENYLKSVDYTYQAIPDNWKELYNVK